MKSTTFLKRVLSLIIPLLILSACTKDDPLMNDTEGTYSLEVTGDVSESWDGSAIFLQATQNTGDSGQDGTVLTITLSKDEDNAVIIQLIKMETKTFGKGTYQFIEDPQEDDVAMFVTMSLLGSSSAYISISGSVEITGSSDTMIEGKFDVDLTNFTESNVTVSGTFKARGSTHNLL